MDAEFGGEFVGDVSNYITCDVLKLAFNFVGDIVRETAEIGAD